MRQPTDPDPLDGLRASLEWAVPIRSRELLHQSSQDELAREVQLDAYTMQFGQGKTGQAAAGFAAQTRALALLGLEGEGASTSADCTGAPTRTAPP